MTYFCCHEHRRDAVRAHGTLNGIDSLEVLDQDAVGIPSPRQRTLLVRCVKPLPAPLEETSGWTNQVRIDGGERILDVSVAWAAPATAVPSAHATAKERAFFSALPEADRILVVRTDTIGDFSRYRLLFVQSRDAAEPTPLSSFDPLLSTVDFSFKVECPSDFDCRQPRVCPSEPVAEPEINYLAKDYASFRRLMLDRMSLLAPQWQDRHAADLGNVLVELLAYKADHLSYHQDAVDTEAYLGTARKRVSLRRHARLVDYFVHEGCNARVWVHVDVSADCTLSRETTGRDGKSRPTQFLTRLSNPAVRIEPESRAYEEALVERPMVFELIEDADLFIAHNEMSFYTWGAESCCLPKGAMRATLLGAFPQLRASNRTTGQAGTVLIFTERLGPHTGREEDADPTKRHAVRLTKVTVTEDPLGGRFPDPEKGTDGSIAITEIEWDEADALPFPLCISGKTDSEHEARYIEGISVVLGNIVLVDHGQTLSEPETLGEVPKVEKRLLTGTSRHHCKPQSAESLPPRFAPKLKERSLTHVGMVRRETDRELSACDPTASAAETFRWDVKHIVPSISLAETVSGQKAPVTWLPKRDLLQSGADDTHFVVETEHDGSASIRFGDDVNGKRPSTGSSFSALYRIGNGSGGNIGAESLAHVVTDVRDITSVKNPLPARGGEDPESAEDIRQRAPYAFRVQERAVTAADYARVTERLPGVQRAVATFRWTGSWYTVFVAVDRFGGKRVDEAFRDKVRNHLERYRLAGRDVEVVEPLFVPLEIALHVCVKPNYFRSHVKTALLDLFHARALPDGRKGVFHPDHFSFGQPVFLSPLYEAAQKIPGVGSARFTTFQRQGIPSQDGLDRWQLDMGIEEIARLENDPNFPERGRFEVMLDGGR